MAKYISIPVTSVPQGVIINSDLITSTVYVSDTSVRIWAYGKSYTFAVTGTTGVAAMGNLINAINTAIVSISGPVLTQVVMPSGSIIAIPPAIG